MGKTKVGLAAILFSVLALSACVTTEPQLFKAKASEEKALEMRVQIAIDYLQQGDADMAKKNLFTALELNPDSPRVHEVLGLTYQSTGEVELAEKHFKKMLSNDSNYTRGRNNYAVFLYRQERYDDALDQFERVVDDVYYENRATAYGNLGSCALKLGELEQAEESLKRAVSMGRGRVNPQHVLELTEVYYQQANYTDANKYFDQYRKMVGQSSARALLLGIHIAEKFDDQDAAASYALALKNLYPRSNEYIEYLKSHGKSN